MFIKQLIIDGFKSYANRTVVDGWDPNFNAITGLNGTGKSNILDAICFVLGISNLSQVRVSNLRELVYKQGQGRVTKASVSIIFDNTDKEQSPVGYQHLDKITVTREIVIGGRNKYLINGLTAQLNRVQNLFHSVQLNVNNPNFLIMQGRITKVLNMKPQEILGLIQETAGTRMFDSKRDAAIRTIAKKQHKVNEINKILAEKITPLLEKLRKEAHYFLQWSSMNAEIDRLNRFCVAHMFFKAENTLQKGSHAFDECTNHIESLKREENECDDAIKQIEAEFNKIQSEKEESAKEELHELETNLAVLSKDFTKCTSILESLENESQAESEKIKKTQQSLLEVEAAIAQKKEEGTIAEQRWSQLDAENQKLQSTKTRLEGQQLGFGVKEDSGSLVQQKMNAEKSLAKLKGEKNQIEQQVVTRLKGDMKSKQKEMEKSKKEFRSFIRQQEQLEQSSSDVRRYIDDCKFTRQDLSSVTEAHTQALNRCEDLSQKIDALRARLSRTEFPYTVKEGKVYGRVARLIRISNMDHALAIEVCAGGKLFDVVVDTDKTAQAIISRGSQLRSRVTCIPLNKIHGRVVPEETVTSVNNYVGENATLAKNLVSYESDLEAAMQYIFGRTFICTNAKVAKQVSFHKDIRTRSVTLQGDVFEPKGLVTGGSRAKGGSIIQKVLQLAEYQSKLGASEDEARQLSEQKGHISAALGQLGEYTQQLELLQHQSTLLQERIENSGYRSLEKEIEELESKMTSIHNRHQSVESEISEVEDLLQQLHIDMQGDGNEEDIKKQIYSVKTKIDKNSKALSKAKVILDRLRNEYEQLFQEQSQIQETLQKYQKNFEGYKSKKNEVAKKREELNNNYEKKKAELEKEKRELCALDSALSKLSKKKESYKKRKNDLNLEVRKLMHKLSRQKKDQAEAEKRLEMLLSEYPWIATEREMFGRKGTDYDFSRMDPAKVRSRLDEKQSEQSKLAKKLNNKAIAMKEKAEEEYQNLINRRAIIMRDKEKIEQVIEELNQKKNNAVEIAWRKVNKDFGSIFETLLPGATAELRPPEGMDALTGLEVRVAFGGVWKESLSELSGGQRSLLALSMILSMLLFKPAPMYILDEVDAALDLSHTQNIGRMLKKHFSHSQFIIVSLKEGMFNNANVIFRTQFLDGVSGVFRTQNERQ